MSFQGRVIVINQLAATKLFHRLICLCPPAFIIDEIQHKFLNFFWQGKHWLPSRTVFAPLKLGGQNLIDLSSRVKAFRLNYLQRYLYSGLDHPSFLFADFYFRSVDNLKYTSQLFTVNFQSVPEFLPNFYLELLRVWKSCIFLRKGGPLSIKDIFHEALFFNDCVSFTNPLDSSLINHFISAGITKVGDLFDPFQKTWHSPSQFKNIVSIHSDRILSNTGKTLVDSIP